MSDSFTIVYESVFRTFRNAAIGHVRTVLKAAFGDGWQAEVESLFSKEWPSLVAAQQGLASKGLTTATPRDALDYLGPAQLQNLVQKWSSIIIPDEYAPTEAQKKSARKALLQYLSDVAAFRNATAHPSEDDLSAFDALRAIDSSVRAAQIMGLGDAVATLEEARTSIIPHVRIETARQDAPIPQNLPSRDSIVIDFVGRHEELADLWRWYLDPYAKRWLLTGEGGKGKTAIAYEFAAQLATAAPKDLFAIHWMSGKQRRFHEGEISAIDNPDVWDLDSTLDSLISTFGEAAALRDASTDAKRGAVLELLSEFPSLIVADDLDTVQYSDDSVVQFLFYDVASVPETKVLATSRREIAGLSQAKTQVRGLTLREDASGPARDFLVSRAQLLDIDASTMTDRRVERICRLTEGSPLWMEDMLRLFRFYAPDRAIEQWRARDGSTAREYALSKEVEALGDRARMALQVFALAGKSFSIDDLSSILGTSDDDVVAAITELRRLYLLPGMSIVDDIPRYQINPNLASFVKNNFDDPVRRIKIENAIQGFLGRVPSGEEARAVADYRRQAEVFIRRGDVVSAQSVVQRGLDEHPNRATLFETLGRVHSMRGSEGVVEAREAFSRAHNLGRRAFELFDYWSDFELSRENWSEAARVAELGLETDGDADPRLLQRAGYARSRLAYALAQQLDSESADHQANVADRHLERALDLFSRRGGDVSWRSKAHRATVINASYLRRQELVCDRLARWLEDLPDDHHAWREYSRQKDRCPQLQGLITSLGQR